MNAIFQSFLLVAASEMGDKTQLLALLLVTRFKKPWPIMGGILVATLLNHGLASTIGTWISQQVAAETLKWILAATFLVFGAWILIPDKDEELKSESRWGAFLTTTVAFFLAEMGDKTQLATVALSARFQNIYLVTAGTTLGMLLSDGLAVFLGERLTSKIPMKAVRIFSATLFAIFGLAILLSE